MAINKYNDDKYLSTDQDIRTILAKCKTCYRTNNYGKLIFLMNELMQHHVETQHPKMSIFLNTQSSQDQTGPIASIGHWMLLCYDIRSSRKCFILDSLSNLDQNAKTNINTFCKNNRLDPYYYSARYQNITSKSCGFLSLFMHYQFSHNNLRTLLKIRRSIQSSPVKHVEDAMMKRMAKHYNIHF